MNTYIEKCLHTLLLEYKSLRFEVLNVIERTRKKVPYTKEECKEKYDYLWVLDDSLDIYDKFIAELEDVLSGQYR